VKISYRQAASDDVVRQFRYYLVTLNFPDIAVRFRDAVRRTVESLREHPFVGPRYGSSSPQLQNLRSWPVAGFEAIRIITFWRKTPSASFASCTASAMLNASLSVRQAPD
jgi:plasmid stabilization system protein ParE